MVLWQITQPTGVRPWSVSETSHNFWTKWYFLQEMANLISTHSFWHRILINLRSPRVSDTLWSVDFFYHRIWTYTGHSDFWMEERVSNFWGNCVKCHCKHILPSLLIHWCTFRTSTSPNHNHWWFPENCFVIQHNPNYWNISTCTCSHRVSGNRKTLLTIDERW